MTLFLEFLTVSKRAPMPRVRLKLKNLLLIKLPDNPMRLMLWLRACMFRSKPSTICKSALRSLKYSLTLHRHKNHNQVDFCLAFLVPRQLSLHHSNLVPGVVGHSRLRNTRSHLNNKVGLGAALRSKQLQQVADLWHLL